MKHTGMKNRLMSMIPISMIPTKMMPMEDPTLDCLPMRNSQKKMLLGNMPKMRLKNGNQLHLMVWAILQKTTLFIAPLLSLLP